VCVHVGEADLLVPTQRMYGVMLHIASLCACVWCLVDSADKQTYFAGYGTEYAIGNAVVVTVGGMASSFGGGWIADRWMQTRREVRKQKKQKRKKMVAPECVCVCVCARARACVCGCVVVSV